MSYARACNCTRGWTIEYGYESVDYVISGTVINSQKIWTPDLQDSAIGYFSVKVLIVVESIFKGGNETDTLTVHTGAGFGDCGVPFLEGKKYVIYGLATNNKDRSILTNVCLGTQIVDKKHLKMLEKLKKNI